MLDPRKLLNDFQAGLGKLGQGAPEVAAAFVNMTNACFIEGEIPGKYKELMALSVSCYARCEYCMAYHVFKCFEEGANRDEILEAATLAIAFGGTPSMTQVSTLILECIDTFEK